MIYNNMSELTVVASDLIDANSAFESLAALVFTKKKDC